MAINFPIPADLESLSHRLTFTACFNEAAQAAAAQQRQTWYDNFAVECDNALTEQMLLRARQGQRRQRLLLG